MRTLPPAPDLVHDRAGTPRFGTYAGAFDTVDLSRLDADHALAGMKRVARHKKWVYGFAASEEVVVLCAVVDTTYSSTAFALVADPRTGEVLADRSVMAAPPPLKQVGPDPAEGMSARYQIPGTTIRMGRARGSDSYRIQIRLAPSVTSRARLRPDEAVTVSIGLDAAHERPLSVVAPVDGGGRVNVTMKSAALPASGTVTVGERNYWIDGGSGGLDYTHGYLARETAWRWAFGTGRTSDDTPIAFNLVEGFNEARDDVNENGLWLGGRLIPLDRARFNYDPQDPIAPWQVRTVDGSVELDFAAYAVHSEKRNLGVIRSRFVQPVGSFTGTIRLDGVEHRVENLPGVTEDQYSKW